VGQAYRRRRRVGVKSRGVFGTPRASAPGLVTCGWTITTACGERRTLDSRQRVAASGRRVTTLCQGEAGFLEQWVWVQTDHPFVLPPARLRPALAKPMPPMAWAQPPEGDRAPQPGRRDCQTMAGRSKRWCAPASRHGSRLKQDTGLQASCPAASPDAQGLGEAPR
jgi:hypothetical protein